MLLKCLCSFCEIIFVYNFLFSFLRQRKVHCENYTKHTHVWYLFVRFIGLRRKCWNRGVNSYFGVNYIVLLRKLEPNENILRSTLWFHRYFHGGYKITINNTENRWTQYQISVVLNGFTNCFHLIKVVTQWVYREIRNKKKTTFSIIQTIVIAFCAWFLPPI